MPTYTSKTLIKGQTPIGQNADGSYIYEQNMSVAPMTPKNITPIELPEALPTVKIGGISTGIPKIDPEIAKRINAPVRDVAGLNKRINPEDQRVKELRQHFDYLKQNNELQLNQEQTDYTRRFKAKYPDYENVPDVILYGKVMLADPKVQEKYGNIGEKTFLQRAGKFLASPIDIVEAGIEGVQAYKDYNPQGALETGVAITSGVGKFVGDTFTNVGANLINLGVPREKNLRGATSTSELLGKNVGETLKGAGDIVSSGIDWMAGEGWTEDTIQKVTEKIQNDPEAKRQFEAAMNILNVLPLGFANKSTKALTAKNTINRIKEQVIQKSMTGKATTEIFEAGMNKGLKEGLSTGATTLNEWMKQLPPEKPKGTTLGSKITRTVPEKTVANFLNLTPTERANVEKILGGKTSEQYILEKNLGGTPKGELADIFQKQATDSYNGIKEQLAKIDTRIESNSAKTAIDDMLETFDSLSSLEKTVYKQDIDYLKQLKEQADYSLSELHALRQAFDKVNTGMYTAKGQVRSGTRAGAEVEVRNGLSNDIQDNAIKNGVDVKEMNRELRVALTLKDGILRSLSQEAKNNLVGLQDIGIMGIFSGGNPLTAVSLGIGKKFLEGNMPGMAQKLYNLNKTPYENVSVMRGNTISTGGGSRLFGLSDNVGGDSATGIPKVIPQVNKTPTQRLAQAIEKGTTLDKQGNPIKFTPEEIMKHIEKLTDEELVELAQSSPKARQYVEIKSMLDYTNTNIEKYGVLPPSEIKDMVEYIQKGKFTPGQEAYMLKNMPKEIKTEVQRQNRIKDFGEDFTEKKTVNEIDTKQKSDVAKGTPELPAGPEKKRIGPGKKSNEIKIGITSVKGKLPTYADNIIAEGESLYKTGDIEGAKIKFEEAVQIQAETLKKAFDNTGITIKNKGIGYGIYDNKFEPNFDMSAIVPEGKESLFHSILSDIADRKYHQKSVLTYKDTSIDTLGPIQGKLGKSVEPRIHMTFDKSLELDEMEEIYKIIEESGLYGGSFRDNGKTLDILNISHYNTDYENFAKQINTFTDKIGPYLDSKGIVGTHQFGPQEVWHAGDDLVQAGATYRDVQHSFYKESPEYLNKGSKFSSFVIEKIGNRKTVTKQEIESMLKSGGASDIEKKVISDIIKDIDPKKKILVSDIQKKIEKEMLPINSESSRKYADYGLDNVGLYNGETIVYSTPVKHGKTGHFSNEGLFGHARISVDGDIGYVVEVQSDLFQHDLPALPNPKYVLSEKESARLQELLSLDYEKTRPSTASEKAELERLSQKAKRNRDKIIKEGNEKYDKLKAFGKKDKYRDRILEETMYELKKRGADKVRVATPSTAAKIEGFAGEGAPYRDVHGTPFSQDTRLGIGDTVDYAGEEYMVVGEIGNRGYNSGQIILARREDVNTIDIYDYIEETINYRMDEAVSELSDEIQKGISPERAQELLDNNQFSYESDRILAAISNQYDTITLENIDEVKDTARNFVEGKYDVWEDLEDIYGRDKVFSDERGSTAYVVENNSQTEQFGQPSEYDSNIPEGMDDSVEGMSDYFSENQISVLKNYYEIEKYLKKYAKENNISFNKIEENGNTWYELPIITPKIKGF